MAFRKLAFFISFTLLSASFPGLTYAAAVEAPTPRDWAGLTQPYEAPRRLVQIITPDFDEASVTTVTSGIRPIHQVRPQIDATLKGAFMYGNNWGHGGAGITLAPGSAKMVCDTLFQTARDNAFDAHQPVAILGGGINGLWTARHLINQGISPANITLYAKDFENTVSHMAAGMWLPISIPRGGGDPDFFATLEDDSYHAYAELANNEESPIKGVKKLPMYTFNMEEEARRLATRKIVPEGEPVILQNQYGKTLEAVYWQTFFRVDPSLLMPSLKSSLEQAGVTFTLRTFSEEREFYTLGAPIIINCLGLGNRELLQEGADNLRPSKGELVYLPPNPCIDYMIFGVMAGGRTFGYIPRGNGLCIGVTRKPGDISQEPNWNDAMELLARGRELFGSREAVASEDLAA